MHHAHQAHALALELRQRSHALAERIAVLDALECHQLAGRIEAARVVRAGGHADAVRMARERGVDQRGACQRMAARGGKAVRRQRPLLGIDH
jgi:hypothetical protein